VVQGANRSWRGWGLGADVREGEIGEECERGSGEGVGAEGKEEMGKDAQLR